MDPFLIKHENTRKFIEEILKQGEEPYFETISAPPIPKPYSKIDSDGSKCSHGYDPLDCHAEVCRFRETVIENQQQKMWINNFKEVFLRKTAEEFPKSASIGLLYIFEKIWNQTLIETEKSGNT